MNSASLPPSPSVRTSASRPQPSARVTTAEPQIFEPADQGVVTANHVDDRIAAVGDIKVTAANKWKPPVKSRAWKWIVMHHTASEAGSVKSIDATHKQRRDAAGNSWLGIGYHFVIGNGHGMKDGEIQPTFRWKKQLHGAHAGVAKYNNFGIGIVLVGNFENRRPTNAQLVSAQKLVRTLRGNYGIQRKNVLKHGDLKKTACPGRFFSLAKIVQGDNVNMGSLSAESSDSFQLVNRREVQ